eukprot:jgi/Chlat1/1732/Chrsp13S02163
MITECNAMHHELSGGGNVRLKLLVHCLAHRNVDAESGPRTACARTLTNHVDGSLYGHVLDSSDMKQAIFSTLSPNELASVHYK